VLRPRRRLTAAKLAGAITITLANRAVRERAADLGRRVRQEDGVREAVAVLERAYLPSTPTAAAR